MVLDLELDAVFVRTNSGQQELVRPSGHLSPIETRLLSTLTGFTPIRVLADLGFVPPRDAIETLRSRRLIELQSPDHPA